MSYSTPSLPLYYILMWLLFFLNQYALIIVISVWVMDRLVQLALMGSTGQDTHVKVGTTRITNNSMPYLISHVTKRNAMAGHPVICFFRLSYPHQIIFFFCFTGCDYNCMTCISSATQCVTCPDEMTLLPSSNVCYGNYNYLQYYHTTD